jgi:MFS family permease
MSERRILYVTAFIRALTTSLVGVLVGVYLAKQGLTGAALGAVISAGLLGAATAAVAATFLGDRVGRRRFLLGVTALSSVGTIAFALSSSPLTLAVAAFFGMLNGMGKDRGAALILEQAALPSLAAESDRTRTIAWYTMLQDLGHGAGAALAALVPVLGTVADLPPAGAHRVLLAGCAGLGAITLILYQALGMALERGALPSRRPLTKRSRSILTRISALFAIDALGGGFLTAAMLSYFFFERFGVGEAAIGGLFAAARVMNAGSHLGAAWLAARIGLVNTMVFTHLPSSLLLMTVAVAPSFEVAAVLFLLREGLVEMDVPTRQSYVLAVVEPEERTFASGITNLVRLGAWAVAPAVAGAIAGSRSLHIPLITGAAMKVIYDLLLWRAFRAVRPPEEASRSRTAASPQ